MEIEYNDYIGIYRGATDKDFCNRVIEKFEDEANKDASEVHNGELQFGSATGRKDKSLFFDQIAQDLASETNRILDTCLDKYMNEYVGLRQHDFVSQYVKVQKTEPKGGYHVWHSEQGADLGTANRCLVWTLYLNDIAKGQGETEFLHQGFRLHPEAGMVCLFPASWTHVHRGNFTTTDTKYIATGWYNLTRS